jgi:hypothetical protein
MTGSMDNFRKESWGVHPTLDVADLFPPAIMFSIHSADPRSKYRGALKQMSERETPLDANPPPSLTPELMRQGLLAAAWDAVFHEVPGDRIALLYQNEGRQLSGESASHGGKAMASTYSVMIKSTEPPGPKWLVTRAAQVKGKAVCWCIPVEVEKGKTTDIKLTAQNVTALDML